MERGEEASSLAPLLLDRYFRAVDYVKESLDLSPDELRMIRRSIPDREFDSIAPDELDYFLGEYVRNGALAQEQLEDYAVLQYKMRTMSGFERLAILDSLMVMQIEDEMLTMP